MTKLYPNAASGRNVGRGSHIVRPVQTTPKPKCARTRMNTKQRHEALDKAHAERDAAWAHFFAAIDGTDYVAMRLLLAHWEDACCRVERAEKVIRTHERF